MSRNILVYSLLFKPHTNISIKIRSLNISFAVFNSGCVVQTRMVYVFRLIIKKETFLIIIVWLRTDHN